MNNDGNVFAAMGLKKGKFKEVVDLVQTGKIEDAIKAYRKETGSNRKDAKLAVQLLKQGTMISESGKHNLPDISICRYGPPSLTEFVHISAHSSSGIFEGCDHEEIADCEIRYLGSHERECGSHCASIEIELEMNMKWFFSLSKENRVAFLRAIINRLGFNDSMVIFIIGSIYVEFFPEGREV